MVKIDIYTNSITDLRNKLNWLNTEDFINYKILKKTITYNLPYNLRNKIKLKQTLDFYVITIPLNYTNQLSIASNMKGKNSLQHHQLDGINYPSHLEIKNYILLF